MLGSSRQLSKNQTFDFNERFLNLYHLTPEHFICLGWEFYKAFRRRVDWTEKELESVVPMALKLSFPQALKMLAAPRQKFKDEYRQVQAKEACQAPYEPNPLLWMPIIAADERYYALYPELVAYDAQATVGGQAAQGWETLDLHPICRSARYLFEHLNPGGKRDDSDVIYNGDKSKPAWRAGSRQRPTQSIDSRRTRQNCSLLLPLTCWPKVSTCKTATRSSITIYTGIQYGSSTGNPRFY